MNHKAQVREEKHTEEVEKQIIFAMKCVVRPYLSKSESKFMFTDVPDMSISDAKEMLMKYVVIALSNAKQRGRDEVADELEILKKKDFTYSGWLTQLDIILEKARLPKSDI